jgi:hypothetical protein
MIHQIEYLKEEFLFNIKKKEYSSIIKVMNIALCDTFEQIILN